MAKNLVYEKIREGIIKGDLKPGQPITEESLSQSLSVSRTPHVLTSAWKRGAECPIVIVNVLDEAVTTDIELNLGRLGLRDNADYRVSYRLRGERKHISGSELAQLGMSLGAKAGDLIHIQPA